MKTITLDQAKELKELGFEAESYWFWHYDPGHRSEDNNRYYLTNHGFDGDYSAYTMQELWDFLPETIDVKGYQCELALKPNVCVYQWDMNGDVLDHYGSTDYKDDILTALYSTLKWLLNNGYADQIKT